jgi:hypothetical protein
MFITTHIAWPVSTVYFFSQCSKRGNDSHLGCSSGFEVHMTKKASLVLLLLVAGLVGCDHTIDFIHLHRWPVFNVADVCITVGAPLLIIQLMRERPPARRAEVACVKQRPLFASYSTLFTPHFS